MTPEPSNEYQELVEALERAIVAGKNLHSELEASDAEFDTEDQAVILGALEDITFAEAALSALKLPHAGDDGWQDIATAPHACHVLAARFDDCEWVYGVVLSPPGKPFTHWRPLPTPPAGVSDNA